MQYQLLVESGHVFLASFKYLVVAPMSRLAQRSAQFILGVHLWFVYIIYKVMACGAHAPHWRLHQTPDRTFCRVWWGIIVQGIIIVHGLVTQLEQGITATTITLADKIVFVINITFHRERSSIRILFIDQCLHCDEVSKHVHIRSHYGGHKCCVLSS